MTQSKIILTAFIGCALASAQTITVTPKNPYIGVGLTQQFKATVTGLTNTTVTWSLNGMGLNNPKLGTITAGGLYTAPATIPAQNPVTVQATGSDGKTIGTTYVLIEPLGPTLTSIAPASIPVSGYTTYTVTINGSGFIKGARVLAGPNEITVTSVTPTKIVATGGQSTTGNLGFTVTNPGSTTSNPLPVAFVTPVSGGGPITVSPAAASVALGGTKQFTAAGQTGVTWTASAGTITSAGLYTAPATMPASSTVTITAAGSNNQKGTATVTLTAGTLPVTVSPAAANVTLGGTQQFTASGQTSVTWTASAGTINSAGLYTAPATMPAPSSVTITATLSNNVKGTASVTLVAPVLPITVSPAAASMTLGGTQQFTASGQTSVTWTATAGAISGTGLYTAPSTMPPLNTVTISATGAGSQAGTATVTLTAVANPKVSNAAAHRFLEQAAFGPSPSDVASVQALGFQGWLNQQFAMAPVSNYTAALASSQGGLSNLFLANAVTNPDQLRQRVAFALSQITVISVTKQIWNQNVVPFENMLLNDAFTNYRQILGDVTLSPCMGYYLDMGNNAAANPSLGTVANENYAREVMQLFSIGPNMLNADGSFQKDAGGNLIPSYNQTNVTELARVMTGWTFAPSSGSPQWGINVDGYTNMNVPMVSVAAYHDGGAKNLLNGYVSPAGLTPLADLDGALDNIFNHPNAGPFVVKQLIQHLVKSNPSPGYISRVVAAFDNNGSGVRGDMKAVIAAILLDPEARANDNGGNDQPADGHLQEPVVFVAGFVRALGGQMNPQNYFPWDLSNMGQDIFNPASVFNYYSPNYGVPGTSLEGGEFQIYDTYTSIYRANLVSGFFSNYSNPVQTYGPGTTVDLTPYLPLASNPTALVNALDNTLTGGVLPGPMKQIVESVVAADAGTSQLRQVQDALYLILTSSYYNVWH